LTGYLRTLLLFYRRHLRVQPLRELMAVVGVAAGVALLFAVQVAHHSITGSFEQITKGVAGRGTLEVAARGPSGFEQRVAASIERLPEVKATAPILQQPIIVVGPRGRRALTLVGATEQLAQLGGNLALAFQQTAEASKRGILLLTEPSANAIGVRPGGRVTLLIGGRTERAPLSAIVSSAKIGAAAESPIAAAPLPVVQSLARLQGRVTRLLIEPDRGDQSSLRRTLASQLGARLNVRPVSDEVKLLANAAGSEREVTLLFSAISIVAGVILAYNALLLASEERRRFIVSLIETGAPDSMIVASLAFDALILGLAGSILGLLAGDLISLIAYRSVPGYLAAAFAVGGQRVITTQAVLIAVAAGLTAAFAAAALPAIVALRAGAAAEPEAIGRTLSFAGRMRLPATLLFFAGLTLLCSSIIAALLIPSTTVLALVGLALGLVICLPTILRYMLRLARIIAPHSGDPAAVLSVAELRNSPTRSAALLATGTIAVFLMVVIGGSVSDVKQAARTGAGDLLSSADLWIKPGGPENVYTTQPFASANDQHSIGQLDVVRSVLPWRDSFLDVKGRRVWVLGVPPQVPDQIAPSQLIDGSLALADQHLREGGWAALSQPLAQERHLHIGQRFTLPTPSGKATLRLAATVANYGWLPGAIVMNGNDHARLWQDDRASQLSVALKPGVPIDRGKRIVQEALSDPAALSVKTSSQRRAEVSAVLGSTLSRLNDTTIVVLIAAVASVIALMTAAIWQRRDRLDSLKAIGMSSGQFVRLVFYESGSVLLVGCLIGAGAGLIGQYLIDGWLHTTTGASVHFHPAWLLALRTIIVAGGISIAAAMIAVIRTTTSQPRAALSTE
jgi:putative ABC transport system permease protein